MTSKSDNLSIKARSLNGKTPKGRVDSPHDASTLVEEAVVHLHGLIAYCQEDLTDKEEAFIRRATKNLAVIHRRLQDGP
jgi:hypothetical protein